MNKAIENMIIYHTNGWYCSTVSINGETMRFHRGASPIYDWYGKLTITDKKSLEYALSSRKLNFLFRKEIIAYAVNPSGFYKLNATISTVEKRIVDNIISNLFSLKEYTVVGEPKPKIVKQLPLFSSSGKDADSKKIKRAVVEVFKV